MSRSIEIDTSGFAFDTERLRMRPLEPGDEALFIDLYTDAETMRYIGEPLSQERAMRSFRKALAKPSAQSSDLRFFAMLEKLTHRSIGMCAIQSFDIDTRRAEIGMMLKSEARGRRHATEALAALVTATFSVLPIDTVWVQYSPEHLAAERLVASIGFKRCADRGFDIEHGVRCVWSIDRSTWGLTNTTRQPREQT